MTFWLRRDDDLANDDARWREIDEDWYRSGRRYREFPTLPGRASADFPKLVESPELRQVLAEVAAVRRRVRAARHTGAHRHGVLLGRRNRCDVLLHAAPSARCAGRSRIADRPLRRAECRARRFVLASRADSGRGGAHRPERRALRVVRPCARRGGAAGAAPSQRQLRGRRRERMAPRAVARGARKQTPALLPRGLAGRRASCARRGETFGADVPHRDSRSSGPHRRWMAARARAHPRRTAVARGRAIRDGALRGAESTSRAGSGASSTSRSTSTTWT